MALVGSMLLVLTVSTASIACHQLYLSEVSAQGTFKLFGTASGHVFLSLESKTLADTLS